jgi:hypothetical protein
MPRVSRWTRPLLGAALVPFVAIAAACTDRALPTAARPGAFRANAAPLGVPQLVGSALDTTKCVDIAGASQANGARATLSPCNGGPNQQLTFTAAGELRVYGDRCLDVNFAGGPQGVDGDYVQIWTCQGQYNQRWQLTPGGQIVDGNGRCLDVPGGNTATGTALIVWTCNGGPNQRWVLRSAAGADFAPVDSRAELPRVLLDTRVPAVTGRRIDVRAGDQLQAALDAAQPGDEVVIAPGTAFVGNFRLKAKPGTDTTRWITVRSGGTLPAPGTRVGPGDAAQMPKLLAQNNFQPALQTEPGAQGWRITGLEFAPDVGTTYNPSLVTLGADGPDQAEASQVPSRIVLDRVYIHGHDQFDLQRCLVLNSAASAVIDSYLTQCRSKLQESDGIHAYNAPGPYKIVNNYIAGGHIGIFFGGDDPSLPGAVPADIEIRRNHITRPADWEGRYELKNLLEFKSGRRALIEANVFENNWRTLNGQGGFAFVIKAANPYGDCPHCSTEDVTIRYNLVRNTAQGFQIAEGGLPVDRLTIAHNVITGVREADGHMYEITGAPTDVTIANNSGLAGFDRSNVSFATQDIPLPSFVFRNNVAGGRFTLKVNAGGVGPAALEKMQIPAAQVSGNGFLLSDPSDWWTVPPGNASVASLPEIGFESYAAGNLALLQSSPFIAIGTGGSRPGADVAAVNRMTQGVVR